MLKTYEYLDKPRMFYCPHPGVSEMMPEDIKHVADVLIRRTASLREAMKRFKKVMTTVDGKMSINTGSSTVNLSVQEDGFEISWCVISFR